MAVVECKTAALAQNFRTHKVGSSQEISNGDHTICTQENAPEQYGTKNQATEIKNFGYASCVALSIALAFSSIAAVAQSYTPLYTYSINAGAYSGIFPAGVMSQGRDGLLYSTIQNNGTTSTRYSVQDEPRRTSDNALQFLLPASCTDGSYP